MTHQHEGDDHDHAHAHPHAEISEGRPGYYDNGDGRSRAAPTELALKMKDVESRSNED